MNESRSDYRRGLLYFGCLMVCICLFFTTPDGDSIFNKVLGLLGISPGIPLGNNGMLYIYGLIPLAAIILCTIKVFKYWRGYGSKFKEYNVFLRVLPVIIVLPVLFFSNIVSPSGIDRIYGAVISQRTGLQAITYNPTNDLLSYDYSGNSRTYSYDFTFSNHSNEPLAFNVELVYHDMASSQEVYVRDANGAIKTFTLSPKQSAYFNGEFTEYHQTTSDYSGGQAAFSVVLLNENEQYSPKPLVRYLPGCS